MNSPISNFELGQMTHREYEAEASRWGGRPVTGEEKSDSTKIAKLAVAFVIGLIQADAVDPHTSNNQS